MATTSYLLPIPIPPSHPLPPLRSSAISATRRSSIILPAVFLHLSAKSSHAFEFRMTAPDQTLEEAESAIEGHAQSLLKVKEPLMTESWKEAQKLLRKSSALLKQDIYTLIQGKPAAERARLRELYSELFNGVTRLDYAARDKDRIAVWECYHGIVVSLSDILSRL